MVGRQPHLHDSRDRLEGRQFQQHGHVHRGRAPPPPTIASVVVAEAGSTKNGVLESNEALKITWAASSPNGIASQTMTVDGQAIAPINGPYGGLYYSCPIGTLVGRQPHLHDHDDRLEGRLRNRQRHVLGGSHGNGDHNRRVLDVV